MSHAAAHPRPRSWKSGALHLREWDSEGLPVLLLHGMAAHTHWWDAVAPRWRGVLRAAAVDFRGHGDSDWTEDGVYTAETWLQDVEDARRTLGFGRFLLVAHSMGARIAIEYAARHPDRLLGLVAVDFLPEVRADKPSRFSRARGRKQPVYASAKDVVERFRLEPDGTLLGQAQVRELGAHGVRPLGEGYSWKFDWRSLTHYRMGPVWPELPQVRVPSLVVRGGHSTVLTHDEFVRVAQALPGARPLEIPRAHHHVPLDAPAELADAVSAFAAPL